MLNKYITAIGESLDLVLTDEQETKIHDILAGLIKETKSEVCTYARSELQELLDTSFKRVEVLS